jgi:hypothetical protein
MPGFGATWYAPPLVDCFNQLSQSKNTHGYKMCVLITDGLPNDGSNLVPQTPIYEDNINTKTDFGVSSYCKENMPTFPACPSPTNATIAGCQPANVLDIRLSSVTKAWPNLTITMDPTKRFRVMPELTAAVNAQIDAQLGVDSGLRLAIDPQMVNTNGNVYYKASLQLPFDSDVVTVSQNFRWGFLTDTEIRNVKNGTHGMAYNFRFAPRPDRIGSARTSQTATHPYVTACPQVRPQLLHGEEHRVRLDALQKLRRAHALRQAGGRCAAVRCAFPFPL